MIAFTVADQRYANAGVGTSSIIGSCPSAKLWCDILVMISEERKTHQVQLQLVERVARVRREF